MANIMRVFGLRVRRGLFRFVIKVVVRNKMIGGCGCGGLEGEVREERGRRFSIRDFDLRVVFERD